MNDFALRLDDVLSGTPLDVPTRARKDREEALDPVLQSTVIPVLATAKERAIAAGREARMGYVPGNQAFLTLTSTLKGNHTLRFLIDEDLGMVQVSVTEVFNDKDDVDPILVFVIGGGDSDRRVVENLVLEFLAEVKVRERRVSKRKKS